MKVSKVIELLKDCDPEEEIICAWWGVNEAPCDANKVEWEDQVDIVDEEMDWSSTHDDMANLIQTNTEGYWKGEEE